MQDYLNIVVTGEVDSGKTTLIGRFLYDTGSLSQGVIEEIEGVCLRLGNGFEFAYILDSLEEERRDQLTIDTTQVFCKTKKGKRFIFIDVPGHQELLLNMLCGSSYADIAILTVDVRKSIEKQAKRHMFILKFLGVGQVIIALNKMDLAGFDEAVYKRAKERVAAFFEKIQIKPKYFIPISANQGENLVKRSKKMNWYKGLSLAEGLNSCRRSQADGSFRLPVQDIYYLNKEKIAIGRIISGKIKKGDKVTVLPINKECRIDSIKIFNKNYSAAKCPQGVGLVLDDMGGLGRGQVICKPRLPEVTREISARIFCTHPLDSKENLRLNCATQDVAVRIKQVNGVWDTLSLRPRPKKEALKKNNFSEITVASRKPVTAEKFNGSNGLGRFVLRNNKGICAVGIIL